MYYLVGLEALRKFHAFRVDDLLGLHDEVRDRHAAEVFAAPQADAHRARFHVAIPRRSAYYAMRELLVAISTGEIAL